MDAASLEGVDTIIHLAGATIAQRWTSENKQLIKDSRIKSAKMLYDALVRFRESENTTVKHIISASAIGCYPSSSTKLYNEKYPTYAEGFLGEVVQEWEESIQEFQKLDIATSIVRTGLILDKTKGALPQIMKPVRFFAGAPLGDGQQWQSWIHIEDMARLYMHILEEELTGVYNGVAPNPVTNEKLTKVVAHELKKPLFLPNVPEKVLRLALGEMATIVLESQLVSAQKIQEAGFVFTYPTVEQAIENLL